MSAPILLIDGKKPCSGCKKILPADKFSRDNRAACGLESMCRPCNNKRCRERGVKYRESRKSRGLDHKHEHYGVTIPEYNEMLEAQNGRCAICDKLESSLSSSGRRAKALAIDHNHVTGAIRGLLCDMCNRSIGMMREQPELLEKAAAYLREHASNPSGKVIPFKNAA